MTGALKTACTRAGRSSTNSSSPASDRWFPPSVNTRKHLYLPIPVARSKRYTYVLAPCQPHRDLPSPATGASLWPGVRPNGESLGVNAQS